MQMAIVNTRVNHGIEAVLVTVETHISRGLPRFSIVGLPEMSVKESKDRVRSAIMNSHYEFPRSRIVVNLAPADIPKEGSRFDLPIALSILAASGQIEKAPLMQYEFVGELALSGEMRSVPGLIPAAIACAKAKRTLIIPEANVHDINCVDNLKISPAHQLLEICQHFDDSAGLPYFETKRPIRTSHDDLDLSQIKGQHYAKRALEIAGAGGHSLLMVGAPGSGKTMLASRLPSLLPEIDNQQAMDVAAIHSICGQAMTRENWCKRPFRAPHHTASYVALVGGGNPPLPGEISLAHHGVLFLDELPEFKRHALETLREPLEAGKIKLARAANFVEYPAQFQLIAAMNPCPCGLSNLNNDDCRCTVSQINRYRAKVSGPLLDRIDMVIELSAVPPEQLLSKTVEESSQEIRKRIFKARKKQLQNNQLLNASLPNHAINIDATIKDYCQTIIKQFHLSARSYYRILRLAQTIADLTHANKITKAHINEAVQLRRAVQYFNPIKVGQ